MKDIRLEICTCMYDPDLEYEERKKVDDIGYINISSGDDRTYIEISLRMIQDKHNRLEISLNKDDFDDLYAAIKFIKENFEWEENKEE